MPDDMILDLPDGDGIPDDFAQARGRRPKAAAIDPFAHDRYTFRPVGTGVGGWYEVGDPYGEPILYARAPYRVGLLGWAILLVLGPALLGCGCLLLGGAVANVLSFVGVIGDVPKAIGPGLFAAALLFGTVTGAIGGRGRLAVCTDDTGTLELLEVRQSTNWFTLTKVFTLKRGDGKVIARFRRNVLTSLLFNRVRIRGPKGERLGEAYEHAVFTPVFRRFVVPFLDVPLLKSITRGLLKTNFRILDAEKTILGTVNRKERISGKAVLDLTADGDQVLDRRIALTLALVLDLYSR